MQSKNKPAPNSREREHVRRVKLLQCSVCDAGGGEGAPSDAHEIKQGQWWTCVALCPYCHRAPPGGPPGRGAIWRLKKMDELDALAVTISRLMGGSA